MADAEVIAKQGRRQREVRLRQVFSKRETSASRAAIWPESGGAKARDSLGELAPWLRPYPSQFDRQWRAPGDRACAQGLGFRPRRVAPLDWRAY